MSTAASSKPRTYGLSWDGLTRVVTLAVALLALGFLCLPALHPDETVPLVLVAGLLPALLIATYPFAPQSYAIDDETLVVKKRGPDFVLPLKEIASVETPTQEEMGLVLRLAGVGGLFGYYGLFWCKRVGRMRAMMTRRNNLVLIRRKQGLPLLVSPDDVHSFAKDLRERIEKVHSRSR